MRAITCVLAKLLAAVAACGVAVHLGGAAHAQEAYPAKPIEIIVPWGPGGGADILGRVVGHWFETDLKARVPVINMPGASGMIGLGKVASAPGNGYTLGVLTTDTVIMSAVPASQLKMTDLKVLGVLVRQPSGIFARSDGRFKSWEEVVARAKAEPGSISIATTGANSPDEVTVDHLASKDVKLTPVGYAKPGERYTAVLGGHVDLLYEQAGDVKGHLESKAMRPLLFFASRRLAAPFADVPVSSEFGYEVMLPQFRAIVAGAALDPRRAAILAGSLERFSATAEYATYLRDQLALPESFIGSRNAQAFILQEAGAMGRLLSTAGKR